jgi:hypothetical protein
MAAQSASPSGFVVSFIPASQVTIPANSNFGRFKIQVNQSLPLFSPQVSVVVTATLGASQVSATVIFTA